MTNSEDRTLEYLLMLDGEAMIVASGYWVSFRVRPIEKSEKRPQGIKYSLTLHGPKGERVLGYDNAHAPYKDKKHAQLDHVHKGRRTKRYFYLNAVTLLEDFWNDVHQYLKTKE